MTGAGPPPLTADAPLLEAEALERRFGPVAAVRGVSLRAGAGECHLIAGPNGAGKTTLLRLLAGLARPTAGRIAVLGRSLAADPALRRALGLLSHNTHLYDDLTAVENLSFAGRLYGLAEPERLARERLAGLGLADRADEPVRRLSRGMVQRVAIARALLPGPAVLLLDEPFTGLDPQSADQVAGLLEAERRAGRALVLVSHDVEEAWGLATHAHVLVRGVWAFGGLRDATLEGFLARYREALHG